MNSEQEVLIQDRSSKTLPEPLRSWAGRRTSYPRDATIVQLFEEVAARRPNGIAVACGNVRLTYGELNKRANQLAHSLRRKGVCAETMVGVCLERSAELIVALVGILKAGGAYVPFDSAYPRERLDLMLADTRTPLMVTQESLVGVALGDRKVPTIFLDKDSLEQQAEFNENPSPVSSATSLAYVIYTSGSTGKPKGVLVENRSVVRLVFNTNFCHLTSEEVILQFAPISFDASTFEIWGALLHGAKLIVVPTRTSSLEELAATIREHGVTTLWLTAGLFHLFVDERLEDLRPVRQLLAGGDVLSARHVRRVLEKLPNTTVINGYGPTEGTTFTCCHVMRPGDPVPDSVPIGRPISNTFVYILDAESRPVPAGATGELCAAGDGIARGYLHVPEGATEKFASDPFLHESAARMYRTGDLARWNENGTVEFLGRMDNQVKILGHRVEPGEIEVALGQYPGIRQACVVANLDEAGTKRLVSYHVSADEVKPTAQELKAFLTAKMPAYMVPSFYVRMAALPLDPNGKVNRSALPKPVAGSQQSPSLESGSALERSIFDVWRAILRIDRIGLDDNFFDLGGDSLLLVAVHSQLQRLLELDIQVTDLFDFTTVRSLARHLGKRGVIRHSIAAAQEQGQKQREVFARKRTVKGGRP